MADYAVLRVVLTYSAVATIIGLSGHFFSATKASLAYEVPIFISIVLLIPVYWWYRHHRKKANLAKEISSSSKQTVLFWILMLFILALAVRIPSVLLFGVPYEKTPVIYLIVLTVLLIERTDISAFGLKRGSLGKTLAYGFGFFFLLDGVALTIIYLLIYTFTSQAPVQTYNAATALLAMPFMTLCVGLSEEGLFRGYMQTHLEKTYSSRKAILIQAILFGLWHFVWNLSPLDLFGMLQYVGMTFFIGLFFGYFYAKTRNLAPLIFAHGLWDSVPQGIVENQTALNAFQTVALSSQLMTSALPYILSAALTLVFIKYAVKKI